MVTQEVLAYIIGIVGTLSGIVFAVIAYKRNNKTDNESKGKESGMMMTEIGYIKSGVDDIKRKQERQEEHHIEVISRLTTVEESAKSAHHRIDGLEDKINGM